MIDYELYCKIKDYHQNRRLSVPQIARELSIDERTVSRWLNADKYRQREIVPRPSKHSNPIRRQRLMTPAYAETAIASKKGKDSHLDRRSTHAALNP